MAEAFYFPARLTLLRMKIISRPQSPASLLSLLIDPKGRILLHSKSILIFKAMTNLDSILKSRDIILPKKVCSQSYGFSSSHVWMWKLDHKESWVPKNWCFQTVVLKKTLESPLDRKEIKPVNPKGNHPWIFIGRAGAEAPILWLPGAKSQLIGKDPHAGKDWRQKQKEVSEDEMVEWHHWPNGHESEQTWGDSERQVSLVCCSPWSIKESDMTEQLNNSNKTFVGHLTSRTVKECTCILIC